MTNNDAMRKMIESDRDYLRVKNLIFHVMSNDGVTPWMTEEEWLEALPRMTVKKYHRVVSDMLDDSEIEREYNREVIPNATRWVMRGK